MVVSAGLIMLWLIRSGLYQPPWLGRAAIRSRGGSAPDPARDAA
jgi:hypothetical protein